MCTFLSSPQKLPDATAGDRPPRVHGGLSCASTARRSRCSSSRSIGATAVYVFVVVRAWQLFGPIVLGESVTPVGDMAATRGLAALEVAVAVAAGAGDGPRR